ncbi:hypothetical protein Hanom_Chr09g00848321 [Helianthus anomalus]
MTYSLAHEGRLVILLIYINQTNKQNKPFVSISLSPLSILSPPSSTPFTNSTTTFNQLRVLELREIGFNHLIEIVLSPMAEDHNGLKSTRRIHSSCGIEGFDKWDL